MAVHWGDRCGAVRLSSPSVGPPIQCQWVPGHRRGRSYHGPSDASPPPPPPIEGRGGGGRGDGDGVQVADEGDDHQGGFPPHTLLRFVSTLVLLPLAQSCWRQTVCHSRGSGDKSIFRFVFANIRSDGVIQAITWVGFWMLSITWGSRTHAKEGQRYNILTWRLGIFSSWGVCLLWNAKRMGNKMQITSPGLSPSSSTRTGTSQTLSPACHISSNAWQHTRIHKGIIFKSQVTSVCGEGGERTLHSASHSSCRCVDSGTKPILLYLVPIKSSIFLLDSVQTQWLESWALKLQPFYREGFARGSRQLDVPSQRHHWVWHGEDEHNRRQSKSKR